MTDTELPLRHPAVNPRGEIVIYDSHCRFCTESVKNLARWDRSGRLSFLSLHDPEVAIRFPELLHDQLMQEMHVVDRQGKTHRGAEAFRYLTARIPRLYPLAPLLFIPFTLPIWSWAYRQIARRRYRLLGKTSDACDGETCRLH